MNVIVLTVFIGLILVAIFLVLFLFQVAEKNRSSAMRDALLPLAEETPRPANPNAGSPK